MSGSAPYEEEYGLRLGPIKILKGVSPINIATLFFASFFGIAVMSYMNSGQPLIFGEILGNVAGYDTVVVITPSCEQAREFKHKVLTLID